MQGVPVVFSCALAHHGRGNDNGHCLGRCDVSSSALCDRSCRRLKTGFRPRLSVCLSQSPIAGVLVRSTVR